MALPQMFARPSRLLAASATASLLLLAACADSVTSPEQSLRSFQSMQSRDAYSPRLNSSATKYADHSKPHAHGRSGSASLDALALAGPAGTRLLLSTGDVDNAASARGTISKVQVKAFAGESCQGAPTLVRNWNKLTNNGAMALLLEGVGMGTSLQVQANIRGIDGNRTDVVTVCEQVKRAPALTVDVTVPDVVTVGTPVVVGGTITETGGDVGTRADCALVVDGVVVDRATGIWVDAGDAVSCAFTYTFDGTGSHDVQIVVTPTGPEGAGLNPTVPSDNENVQVNGAQLPGWSMQAEDKGVTTTSTLDYHWWKPDGSHKEYADQSVRTENTQTVALTGTTSRDAVFPLHVTLQLVSDGVVLQDQDWSDVGFVSDASGQQCAARQVPEHGAVFHLCSGGGVVTYGYTRFGGRVIYHSEGFWNVWDGQTGAYSSQYSWNDSYIEYASGGQVKPWGADVALRLQVTDAAGSFGANALAPLTPFTRTLSTVPRSCTEEALYWLDGGTQTWCTGSSVVESGRAGQATG